MIYFKDKNYIEVEDAVSFKKLVKIYNETYNLFGNEYLAKEISEDVYTIFRTTLNNCVEFVRNDETQKK